MIKIGVDAPKDVKVFRQEVFNAIQDENKKAAMQSDNLSALGQLFSK